MKKINKYLLAGCIITGILLMLIIIGTFWTPYNPTAMDASAKFKAPCPAHIFGTDSFGRDIFSRVLKGGATTLAIAVATVAIGAVIGTLIGAATGYFGGLVDDVLMRINDALTAFPSILLALLIIALVGTGKYNVVLALGIVFIPSFARVMRMQFASQRDAYYITSARLMGAGSARIMLVHMLPNTIRTLLPAVTIGFNNAVLAEASMSFLGIGVTPPDASLGYMLSEAQGMFVRAPWYAVSTGLYIALLVFGVGLIGEGLQHINGEAD